MRNMSVKKCHVNRFAVIFLFVMLLIVIIYGGICVAHADGISGRQERRKFYTSVEIKYGDTLWTLAERYKSDEYLSTEEYVCELMRMNHLTDDHIIAGNYLMICYYEDTEKNSDESSESLQVSMPIVQLTENQPSEDGWR